MKKTAILIWSLFSYARFKFDVAYKLRCKGQYIAPCGFKVKNSVNLVMHDVTLISVYEAKHVLNLQNAHNIEIKNATIVNGL